MASKAITSVNLFVTHSQIAVFNIDLEMPFNEWTDDLVDQGFSWRNQSVSFKTILDDAAINVRVDIADEFLQLPEALRSISVPFRCGASGKLEVATIPGSMAFDLKPGEYQLVFETGLSGSTNAWCRFSFIEKVGVIPDILKQDRGLSPKYPLLMGSASA